MNLLERVLKLIDTFQKIYCVLEDLLPFVEVGHGGNDNFELFQTLSSFDNPMGNYQVEIHFGGNRER
jgi:hypothetical protein